MKKLSYLAVLLLLAAPLPAIGQDARKLFPYAYTIDDLPNGLRLVTVPTDQPNLVALYIVVNAGSRNEIEPGKSGFAHFFEHMMFRGSENFTADEREAVFKKAGAQTNAYTSDDRTVYHATFAKEDLDEIMKIEADRFIRLKYAEPEYKTEALAVLGEYNKDIADPFFKLGEVLRETAIQKHTYSHTTMGYLRDIQDMPNQFAYSRTFYERFYRPEYTTIVLVGDTTREQGLEFSRRYWSDWKRGDYTASVPEEPPQTAARTAHIDWPSPTLPHVVVAFRAPPFSDEIKDKPALDLLAQIAFGENSDLYQKLVIKEQKVDMFSAGGEDHQDPELFAVTARVKDPGDAAYVQEQILATYNRFKDELVPQDKLDATRSRMKYGFALGMDSSEAIAAALAPYISLRRTPETINKLFALTETITPQDIRDAARKYFTESSRTIVTLTTKAGADSAKTEGK